MRLLIRGADLVTPREAVERGSLAIDGAVVVGAGSSPRLAAPDRTLDAGGLTAFPGLVNAHDHLFGTWSPRAGNGPYRNVYEWLAEYLPHPVRQERLRVPDALVAGLGGFRNLLAGTTTAVDHDRRRPDELFRLVPVRVIRDFGREWVLRSVTRPDRFPPWGRGIAEEMREGGEGRPFIIHAAEGLDEESAGEIAALDALGGLRRNSVIVHAIALRAEGVARIARAGAKVVWCPASNFFLYGATADVRALLEAGVEVCLGTDSTSTGSAHMLDELRVARDAYAAAAGRPLDPSKLVAMATSAAAAVIGKSGSLGVLAPGAAADVLLVDTAGADPFDRLAETRPGNVDLLLLEGRPLVGSLRHEAMFRESGAPFSRIRIGGGSEKLVTGDLPGLLRDIRGILGFEKSFPFLPAGL